MPPTDQSQALVKPTELKAAFESIDDDRMQVICETLRNDENATEANFSYSVISVEGFRILGAMLAANSTINTVILVDTGLDDEKVTALVTPLIACCALTTLDLSGNKGITVASVALLIRLLESENCPFLTSLRLSNTSIPIGEPDREPEGRDQLAICEMLLTKRSKSEVIASTKNSVLGDLNNVNLGLPAALTPTIVEYLSKADLFITAGFFKALPSSPASPPSQDQQGRALTLVSQALSPKHVM